MAKATGKATRRKIGFVGASYLFVPTTVRDMLLNGNLDDSDLYMYDIDPDPVKVVMDVTERMVKQRGANIRIFKAKSRKEALDGADYVVASLLVGGLDVADKEDKLCKRHGIRHTVGDTIGPMSIARILRQAPLLVDIAKDMEKLCPGALLLSPTNPMTGTTTAVNRYTNTDCIGVCHGTHFILRQIAKSYKVKPDDVRVNVVGVNHLAFVDRVWIKDVEKPLKNVVKKVSGTPSGAFQDPAGHIETGSYALTFGGRVGYLPNNGDHHFIEFFPWFLGPHAFNKNKKNRYKFDDALLNIPGRRRNKKRLRKIYSDWAHKVDVIPDMDAYGSDCIQDIILGVEGKVSKMTLKNLHLNVPNGNSVPNLPKEANLEITCKLSKAGVKPVKNPPLDMFRWGLLSRLIAVNELATKAAIEKDKHAFMQALHLDPLVYHFDKIPQLAADLWEINKPHMKPQK